MEAGETVELRTGRGNDTSILDWENEIPKLERIRKYCRMNSLPKLIASIAALIASLAFLWIAHSASKIMSDGVRINTWHLIIDTRACANRWPPD